MLRNDIAFTTTDGVVLRGWFYRLATTTVVVDQPLPCVILSHGFSAIKDMGLHGFASRFVSSLALSCLVYDHRGFGTSATGAGQPRHEILPDQQIADMQDAITYAQSRADVDSDRIAVWGSSYSGGHVLRIGAIDRRVRAVVSQVPCVDGWANYYRLVRPDVAASMSAAFADDRISRAAGKPPTTIAVVDKDPLKPSALQTPDSYVYFSGWGTHSSWQNEVTLRSIEAMRAYNPAADISRIAPTPLLMLVADNDVVAPTDLALEAYSRAHEPKELHLFPGGHFDGYVGDKFQNNVKRQIDFLQRHLLE